MSQDRTRRFRLAATALAASGALAMGSVAATADPRAPTVGAADPVVLTGTLSSGATFEARVPADWNGILVLYSHGFRGPGPNPAWDVNNQPTFTALANRGYAVAASWFATTGWSLGTAVSDELETLQRFSSEYQAPRRTIAYGRSMAGWSPACWPRCPAPAWTARLPPVGSSAAEWR